jgi:hypothetical protein
MKCGMREQDFPSHSPPLNPRVESSPLFGPCMRRTSSGSGPESLFSRGTPPEARESRVERPALMDEGGKKNRTPVSTLGIACTSDRPKLKLSDSTRPEGASQKAVGLGSDRSPCMSQPRGERQPLSRRCRFLGSVLVEMMRPFGGSETRDSWRRSDQIESLRRRWVHDAREGGGGGSQLGIIPSNSAAAERLTRDASSAKQRGRRHAGLDGRLCMGGQASPSSAMRLPIHQPALAHVPAARREGVIPRCSCRGRVWVAMDSIGRDQHLAPWRDRARQSGTLRWRSLLLRRRPSSGSAVK